MKLFQNAAVFSVQGLPISLESLLIFTGIVVCSFILAFVAKKGVGRTRFSHANYLFDLGRLIYYVILVLGVYVALATLGINLTGIAVLMGSLSVGIGFGLQSIFSNFVAGSILLVESKIRPGDTIQLESGEVGNVLSMNMRATLVQLPDHRKVVIPNIEMISKRLTCWSLKGDSYQRFRIPFSVERSRDKKIIKEIALREIEQYTIFCKKYPPEIWLSKLTEEKQELELVVWVDRSKKLGPSESITATLLSGLEKAFLHENIPLLSASRFTLSPQPFHEI